MQKISTDRFSKSSPIDFLRTCPSSCFKKFSQCVSVNFCHGFLAVGVPTPRFDVLLKDIVVMPGQAFELAFTGGPPRKHERTYFDYVSSAPDVASRGA